MSHDAVTCGFARQQSASHDPSSTEIINFGHLSPFMEGTGWAGDLVAAPGNNREGVNKWCAQTSDPLQARAVEQPKLRAQRLKALHGWLTYGSMMERKVLPVTSDKKSRCRLHGGAKGSGGSSSERNGQYVTASGRDCGAAENQPITENAPPWPDIIPKFEKCVVCAALLDMAVEPVACAILVWLEAL
jgi:hypothetical protein